MFSKILVFRWTNFTYKHTTNVWRIVAIERKAISNYTCANLNWLAQAISQKLNESIYRFKTIKLRIDWFSEIAMNNTNEIDFVIFASINDMCDIYSKLRLDANAEKVQNIRKFKWKFLLILILYVKKNKNKFDVSNHNQALPKKNLIILTISFALYTCI